MRTLQQDRDLVRSYFDLDVSDLPDVLVDAWITEGYDQILRSRQDWPHLQVTATIAVVAGTQSYNLPAADTGSTNLRSIHMLYFNNRPVALADHSTMVERFSYSTSTNSSSPPYYSLHGGKVYFWPTPSSSGTAHLVGVREYDITWLSSTTGTPDFPAQYDAVLMKWVLCEAAKQQSDIPLANNFAQDFALELDRLNGNLIAAPTQYPLILGGGIRPYHSNRYPWYHDVSWNV